MENQDTTAETPVTINDEPLFTLNAPEVRVRMRIQGETDVLFIFNRPEARRTREYFSQVRPRFRPQGAGEIKMLNVERSHSAGVLDEYLTGALQLPALEPFGDDVATMKTVLKQPRAQAVLFSLVNTGLFGVEVMDQVNDDDDGLAAAKMDFGSMFAAQPVFLRIGEWSKEGLEQNYYLKVTMDEPNAMQQRALENAQPLVRKKKGDFEHQEDVNACQQLFAKRVQAIDGAQYIPMGNPEADPKPCNRENRGEWLPFVPYQFVSTVLAEEQVKGQLGND